jgi:hypothetical protein
MPSFGSAAPLSYYAIPEMERASRCELGTDDCVCAIVMHGPDQ